MPRNYGSGAYGAGNYSAMTAASLAAARGAFVEAGQVAALAWRTGMAGGFGSFGLAGLASSFKAGFKLASAQATSVLFGPPAILVWAALVAAGYGSYMVGGQAAGFVARFTAAAAQALIALVGQAVSSPQIFGLRSRTAHRTGPIPHLQPIPGRRLYPAEPVGHLTSERRMTTTNLGMTLPTVGADSDTWGNELNTDLGLIDAFAGSLMPQAEVTVASAATTDIGAAASTAVAISGTTTITSFGTGANKIRFVRFTGALTLTHNATSLILLGGASRTTASGDTGLYKSDGSGNWREYAYSNASGSLGAAKAQSIVVNGATLGSAALAVIGDSELIGEVHAAHMLVNGAGGGNYRATGFGTQMDLNFNTMHIDLGPLYMIAGSGGVVLNSGATSWAANSQRGKKKNLQNIPGDSLDIIAAHDVKLGHYIEDTDVAPLRPFLFYEDAVVHYPWATTTTEEKTLTDPENGQILEIAPFKGLSLEQYVPLLMAAFKRQIEINASFEARLAAVEAR